MPRSRTSSTRQRVVCDWWLSRNSTTGPVCRISSTEGRKTPQNHSTKLAPSIHPESDMEYHVSWGATLSVSSQVLSFVHNVQWSFSLIADPHARFVMSITSLSHAHFPLLCSVEYFVMQPLCISQSSISFWFLFCSWIAIHHVSRTCMSLH